MLNFLFFFFGGGGVSGNSFTNTFCVLFFKKNVSHVRPVFKESISHLVAACKNNALILWCGISMKLIGKKVTGVEISFFSLAGHFWY